MTTARVILTSAPTPETVSRVRALLVFAALCAVGNAATTRGVYDPADVSRRAQDLVSRMVDALAHARPVDVAEAHMVAAAIRTAGGTCDVVPA